MKYSEFSTVLKQLRTAREMSQKDLAAVLHVSRSTIAGYESRQKQPDYDKLVQIADYYGVTVDFLLTGRTAPRTTEPQLISNRELDALFLESFHELTYSQKQRVLEYARLLAQSKPK